MNAKTILRIVLIIAALGAGYWFVTDYHKEAAGTAQEKAVSGDGADTQAINAAIEGAWRSTDDPSFTRTFTGDGTVIDTYSGASGQETRSGWVLFTAADPDPDFKGSVATDTTYLKIQDDSGVYFYSVNKATATDLVLTYLDRGNTLSFTRAQ